MTGVPFELLWGPVGKEEAPVDLLVQFVHLRACIGNRHDPFCNTLRLLVQDHRNLTHARRQGRTMQPIKYVMKLIRLDEQEATFGNAYAEGPPVMLVIPRADWDRDKPTEIEFSVQGFEVPF